VAEWGERYCWNHPSRPGSNALRSRPEPKGEKNRYDRRGVSVMNEMSLT
jgi:hypothetical protein